MVTIGDPYADSPTVPEAWKRIPANRRLESVRHALGRMDLHREIAVEEAAPSGRIIVSLRKKLNAAERGEKLRAYEDYLDAHVATGLKVYVQPEPDRNALRRLRGIVVKDALDT